MKIEIERSLKFNKNFIIHASAAVFITYLCMYAFRKPFSAATYENKLLFGLDYKVALIILQLIGYTISKSLGIKFISELKHSNRLSLLIVLLSIALISLMLFGITPYPYNAIFMFINGIPLGMIWGVVFGFIEGRKSTELLGAIMSSSFIVSSGLVKSAGRIVLDKLHVSEMWMPFITALLFIPLLLLGIFLLKSIPLPQKEDQLLRTERIPMSKKDRMVFLSFFTPGIIFSILIYVILTMFRDLRDNFAVEFWKSTDYASTPELLAFSEFPIAIVVVIIISSMILIKNNRIAFYSIFYMTLFAGITMLLFTYLFEKGVINALEWMIIAGAAIYLPYIGYHTLYFERWIAFFRYKSNAGFLMSMADTAGYMGSTLLLVIKNISTPDISWQVFFKFSGFVAGILLIIITIFNFISFQNIEKKFNQM